MIMKSNEKLLWASLKMMLLVGMTTIAMMPAVNVASASPGTQFFVDPSEVRDIMPGNNFMINVSVTEAPSTYAWEIYLSWDPVLLNLTYVKEGDFLHRWIWDEWEEKWIPLYPTTFIHFPLSLDEANLNGQIKIGCSLAQGTDPWASGNGWLCSLGFKVKAQGSSILDLFDTRLWDYIWASTPGATYYPNLDGFFFNARFHNIGLDDIAPDVLQVQGGAPLPIRVTVANKGNYTETSETFNVTVYADTIVYTYDYDPSDWIKRTTLVIGDEITIGTQTVTEPLAPGATTILTFTWNTEGVAWGYYTISAEVKGDDDTRDNIFIDSEVSIFPPIEDVAVTDVSTNTTSVKIGEPVSINATVANQGYKTETFDVTAYYGDISIETQTISNLAPGKQENLQFLWNTTFAPAGVYTISAKVALDTDVNATNDEFINGNVDVQREAGWPIANFTYSVQKPLINQTITFTSTSYDEDGYIESWAWDFNNDGIIDAATETATWDYTQAGYYKVRLLVDDNDTLTPACGVEKMITVYARPIASFTFSPEKPVEIVNQVVTFNASASYDSDGTIVNYSWDFGDDQTGSGKVVTHTYTTFGYYTVTLNVTDNDGLNGTQSLKVQVYARPIASFTYSPQNPLINQVVTFNASASYDSDGTIVNYSWDFGDDQTGSGKVVTHTYTTFGYYTVTLNVTDNDGLSSEPKRLEVQMIQAPSASFTFTPSSPKVFEIITFNASSSTPNGGSVTRYYWDFGDGTIANETDPITTHSYTPADTYTVTLTITDSEGLTATATQSVAAEKLSSTASIDVAPSSITRGESVTITGSITPERKGVTVTILYRLSGEETWTVLDTVTTGDNSQYSHDWTPTAAGTFEIKASWNGDLNTVGDESDIKTITVQEASTMPDPTLFMIVGIIIVIAVAVAVYFIRFRKQKTPSPTGTPS